MALIDGGEPVGVKQPSALAPGKLAKLTAANRARLLKKTPKGLIPTAPFKAASVPSTVLD